MNEDSKQNSDDLLHALKIAFCYMPKAIDVNKYEYGDRVDSILADIDKVKEALLIEGIDPEKVYDEIHPGSSPNSCY